ncbi:MAG TPA: efflux RND transporter periplasmic adaptor subunit [Caulobacteraceae bacterium]|nr:efflux RND transporter periplasmic adaptor subunit [Caulobacteraceae bacterium]
MAAGRRIRWPFIVLGAIAVLLVAWVIFHKKSSPPAGHPAIPVTAAKAASQDVPLTITSLGAVQAWTSDTILAQVSGKLLSVNFAEGTDVKAGQVLAQVDPAPFKAALDQAEGTLARDQAVLAEAKLDLARFQILMAQDSIARQQFEDQQAVVKQDEGTARIDAGIVANAKINLGWCRIVSPISGRAGVRLVDPGNLVSASGSISSTPATASANSTSGGSASSTSASGTNGGSGIVIINQVEPIAVTFTVPEGDFQRLSDASNEFRQAMTTDATSQETGEPLGQGLLTIADNRVDPATGTVELKARFANTDKKLWPGQFVNVTLTLQTLSNVITIPTTAVNHGPNGAFAFVVGANNKVSMRPITVSWTQGQLAVIKSGVKPGEIVVTDGQMILKAGSSVRVVQAAPAG